FSIQLIRSPDFKTLRDLFGKAKIFWSASGYGIDEEKEPKKMEHFGITVVEAMAAGCVPLVIDAGGHKEIIQDGVNGFLWSDVADLYGITKKLSIDEKFRKKISVKAMETAKKYSYEEFEKNFSEYVI